jgi:hypothetical protein
LAAYGKAVLTLDALLPDEPGKYTIVANLTDNGRDVRSLRDVRLTRP